MDKSPHIKFSHPQTHDDEWDLEIPKQAADYMKNIPGNNGRNRVCKANGN